ncbi:MAG: DUF58 domain-containing protein [Chitinophagaceae bacterium]|nr:DUF58 domain-containing protein [Chitinophagaceae bacterium]
MRFIKTYILDLFPERNLYIGLGVCALLMFISFLAPGFFTIGAALAIFFLLLLFSLVDYLALFLTRPPVHVVRKLPLRLSNGEENDIMWTVRSRYRLRSGITLIDEWPEQFQFRSYVAKISLKPGESKKIIRKITPVERGEYEFGDLHLLVSTRLRLFARRLTIEAEASVPCYPSFRRLTQYELHGKATLMNQSGVIRVRRVGQSMEFEQIKEYVRGDDVRTINWKATARRGTLMVNEYIEERAQQIYCIIDKGRLMKMPFEEMTLLDYAINSSLIISSVSLNKSDKTGLITFSDKIETLLAADNRPSQMNKIMDALYNEETAFPECDFEKLYTAVRSNIRNRSLLILFTNFETVSGMKRHLNALRMLARYHLLLVVFFENTELKDMVRKPAHDLEGVYIKTIAEKYIFEKRAIVRELEQYGILTILSAPSDLTFKTLNKYLDLKVKQAL